MWVNLPLTMPGTHGLVLQAYPWTLAFQVGPPSRLDDVVDCEGEDEPQHVSGWRAYLYTYSPRIGPDITWAGHRGELFLDDTGCLQLLDADEPPLLPPGAPASATPAGAWGRMNLGYARHLGVPGTTFDEVLSVVNAAGRLYDYLSTRHLRD